MTELSWAWLSTPVGQVSVGCSPDGVAQVRYGAPAANQDNDRVSQELADAARSQLTEYFRGHREQFDLPLDWHATGGTQRDVLRISTP